MLPEKAYKNKKGNQIRKDVNVSSPQGSNETEVDVINSGPLATRTRSQVHFKTNMTRSEEKENSSG